MKWAGWAAVSLVALLSLVSGGIPGFALMLTGSCRLRARSRELGWPHDSHLEVHGGRLRAIAAAAAMSSGIGTASECPSTTITSPSSPVDVRHCVA